MEQSPENIGAPGAIRTRGTRIRNPLLYPAELRGRRTSISGAMEVAWFGEAVNMLGKNIPLPAGAAGPGLFSFASCLGMVR